MEDDAEIRGSISELLQQDGYTIIEAADGDDGIRRFREHRGKIDLLLLDVIMPKRTGRELYRSIAALAPGIRAVFMSGYTADLLSAKGVLHDGVTLVSKPVSVNALCRKIREALDGPGAGS